MRRPLFAFALSLPFSIATAYAVPASTADELAKQLANPLASLMSVPLQYNYDHNIGPDDKGSRHTLNIQPVLPFSLNDDWNIISRTILPVIHQSDIFPGSGSQSGMGDTLQSLFFSPKAPTAGGWIWGIGPAVLLPTASDDLLGSDQWGLGPTAVVLRQTGPWTYGALSNHIEHITTDDKHADISSTFVQPFLAYAIAGGITMSLSSEATYDWENSEATIPINLQVNKIGKMGKQLIQYGGGIRYWAKSPDAGPEGWGARLNLSLLFPK